MQTYHHDVFPVMGALGILVALLIALGVGLLAVIAWCMIWKRAGYSWALGLLMLVPLANFIAFLVLAFSKWPVEREVERLRLR